MATVTLTFTLPEERSEAEMAQKAGLWYCSVFDVANELRNKLKYTDASKDMVEFSEWFWKMLEDRGIDPYDS